jgi:hypothetical protein
MDPPDIPAATFTHLPSRSVFIDRDRYVSDDSLGFWVAHELGHLAANSVSESDADKAAREYSTPALLLRAQDFRTPIDILYVNPHYSYRPPIGDVF